MRLLLRSNRTHNPVRRSVCSLPLAVSAQPVCGRIAASYVAKLFVEMLAVPESQARGDAGDRQVGRDQQALRVFDAPGQQVTLHGLTVVLAEGSGKPVL